MRSFSNFPDFAEHYASLTSADTFGQAFTAEIEASQLSHHEEPTAADMPDSEAARGGCVEQMVGDLFALFCDTRLAPMAARVAWGMVNSFHKVAQQIAREEDSAARELGELARINDPSEIHALEVEGKAASLPIAARSARRLGMHARSCRRGLPRRNRPALVSRLWQPHLQIADRLADRSAGLSRRARASRREAHAPTGPVVVVSGGAGWQHHEPIWTRLDASGRASHR
ncbi:hypothetical protein [Novosphingobium sp. G106]|uniref:hypothetical protein n=1 Tax=Novosphingobium sp. G106 TaxID=2849500 RepID=UPI0020C26ADC|nr:hypothetical protein [Novosphingobium sp. G106]